MLEFKTRATVVSALALIACGDVSEPAGVATAELTPAQQAQGYDDTPALPPTPEDVGPGDDDFYKPPATLSGQPGDVIRSRATTLTLDPFFYIPEDAVNSRKILYQSTDAFGKAIAVSGTVLVPKAPWSGKGERPLVTYAVGTRGLGDNCAPSRSLSHGDDYEGPIVSVMLDKGWAVAVTDYQGLGTPGIHTYMVGAAEGHAVLDMARAAQRLDGSGLSTTGPIATTGYSQGGGAAGWAAQLAPTYAPELKLVGAAIGGVPADLTATAEFLDGGPFVAFALWAALGLDAAYPELQLASYLNDNGKELLKTSADLCIASFDGFAAGIVDTSFTSFADYTTTSPLDSPAWQARLEEQRIGKLKPTVPIYQYHAQFDEIVPFEQAATLRRTWCDAGVDLQWDILWGFEHALGIAGGPPWGLWWIADRFEGLPTHSNCSDP